jgi:uncharacterized membrane protein
MQTTPNTKQLADRKIWFSMWFLSAIVTFGLAFFPLFYRLVDGRNRHLQKKAEIEAKLAEYFKSKGKQLPQAQSAPKKRNALLWAASIILVIPAFIIMYQVTRDLAAHEKEEDTYLAAALPQRVFMPQTIPQTTYVLITIVTLGVGGVYWLYKIVNQYNLHYKADQLVEKEINRLLEEEHVEHM